MRPLARAYPYILTVALLAIVIVAVVLNDGANGASRQSVTTRFLLEPAGPKPRILYPPPADFENLGSYLKQTQARQQVALHRYQIVFRSYLRWRRGKATLLGPETQLIPQPVRFRCTATNVVMPANWCWYAQAARWTARELEETQGRLDAAARTLPATNDWVTAVRIVQRVYPGTESWLLSCSAAESSHGAWVWNGGGRWGGYHVGGDYLGMDKAGGWMQFRWSTFKPYWFGFRGAQGALADAQGRGFVVPDFGDGYGAWLSPLGQALTAGYMRYTGRDGRHWSASYGNGC